MGLLPLFLKHQHHFIRQSSIFFFEKLNFILPHASVDIHGGKDDGSGWLADWDDLGGVWWDSLSAKDELWKACCELG